jgi:hypothetical protein
MVIQSIDLISHTDAERPASTNKTPTYKRNDGGRTQSPFRFALSQLYMIERPAATHKPAACLPTTIRLDSGCIDCSSTCKSIVFSMPLASGSLFCVGGVAGDSSSGSDKVGRPHHSILQHHPSRTDTPKSTTGHHRLLLERSTSSIRPSRSITPCKSMPPGSIPL